MRTSLLGNPLRTSALGWLALALGVTAAVSAFGCSGAAASKASPDASSEQMLPGEDASLAGSGGSEESGSGTAGADASGITTPTGDAGVHETDAGAYPAGWLYTSGAKIYLSNGSAAPTPWMGRGVNTDDIFFCGYNDTLWMTSPDKTVETIVNGLVTGWKPNFIRMSLAMDSYGSPPTSVSWTSDPAQYATPMTGVINAIGTYPGVHILVTLRSHASMIGQDTADGDPEATGIPSDSMTTPNATEFPTGTDATYIALVDTFANAGFVMFGLTNEPGGDKDTDATLVAAMTHAVGTIRGEEDRLGVPHHIVSVQGQNWTSDISFYATSPLTYDNVVYEVHGYPPTTASYTYSNIPVILGEYGDLTSSTSAAFYADVESKQIPNLAWDFDPYNDCAPDLVNVTEMATGIMPTAWGTIVQTYLLAHAQ